MPAFKWTTERKNQLLAARQANKTIPEIALEFNCTERVITSKLNMNVRCYHTDGKPIDEIINLTRLSPAIVQKIIKKHDADPFTQQCNDAKKTATEFGDLVAAMCQETTNNWNEIHANLDKATKTMERLRQHQAAKAAAQQQAAPQQDTQPQN